MPQSQAQPPTPAPAPPRPESIGPFGDALDAVDQLSPDDQEALIRIVQSRLREHRHNQLLEEVRQSEREYEQGLCKVGTPEEIVREAMR